LRSFKDLIKQLLHIEDSPERTALAYALGIFLGFSPFLGLHTIGGVVVAFLFRMNRVAVLLGVWTNLPWWIIPYYTVATWVGMKVIGFQIDPAVLAEIFRLGLNEGFIQFDFWNRLASQSDLLLAFGVGSLILGTMLSFIAYPLSLRWIKFYRSRRKQDSLSNPQGD